MTAPAAPPRVCPACGSRPRELLWLPDRTRIRQCPRCLLAWWDWPAFEPADLYDRDYFQSAEDSRGYDDYAALEPGLRRTARARLRRIERCRALWAGGDLVSPDQRRPNRPRLLEIGCGIGVFLETARQSGWDVQGIEVSAYAVGQARQRGLAVDRRDFEATGLEPERYDCIALWDVLEHLRDPDAVLQTAGRALRAGGILALSTGDVTALCARLSGPNWHLFNLPEHLYFFSPAALRRLLERAGCRVAQITRETSWVPMGYLLERLRKARGLPAGIARRLLGTVAHGNLARWTLPATLFDVLGVYAVRGGRGRPFTRGSAGVD